MVSGEIKPDCEKESVHEPPKLTVCVATVTDNDDAAKVMGDDVTADAGPVFPAASVTPPCARRNCSVPS